ncbi:S8 family serine peptidase [Spirosoma taeanense]|uniref:S8 family serine peptidase n=1 Tax=Spirosoma taeanense TaxID=2735870 RepID=A0A6M5Y5H1_9BACT|nr:S8 family serine peptidase [Spirosoma taeanense]QJW88666.1 S8 family serine peptidase [Spirosoma taeanense]
MKISRTSIVVLSLLISLLAGCRPTEPTTNIPTTPTIWLAGHYIVVYKTDPLAGGRFVDTYANRLTAVRKYTSQFLKQLAINSDNIEQVYGTALRGFAARLTPAEAERLSHDPRVAYLEVDQVGFVDQLVSSGLVEPSATQPKQVIPWGVTYVGGPIDYKGTAVAWIIDHGIDLDHPDLNVDSTRGYNVFTSGPGAGSLDDALGHGTHMAGIIAAKNNSIGTVGVAAGATVIPIKVGHTGNDAKASNLIAGADFVAAHARPGDVVNASVGVQSSDAVDAAFINMAQKTGAFVGISAGNTQEGSNKDANQISPARANAPNLFTASAHDNKGVFLGVSCSGNPPIDYATPGKDSRSTYKAGGYNTYPQGTSMSAAYMTAVLMASGGKVVTKGYVTRDRDQTPDPIAVVKIR